MKNISSIVYIFASRFSNRTLIIYISSKTTYKDNIFMKVAKADKERRYTRINKLIRKYYTKDRTMPEVYAMIRTELNISQTTVRLAVKSGL